MATGALDANGIWQYGEDDSEPTFSGMLNKLASSTSTTVTRLEEMSGLTAAQVTSVRNNLDIGAIQVTPTSVVVAGAGSSGAASGNGTVTYTSATSVTLNGVFNTTFRRYLVTVRHTTSAASDTIYLRYAKGGVTNSTANYYYTGRMFPDGGTSALDGQGQAQHHIGYMRSNGGFGQSVLEIFDPMISTNSTATFNRFYGSYSGVTHTSGMTNGFLNVADSMDGLTIYSASGALTGVIQVYGFLV